MRALATLFAAVLAPACATSPTIEPNIAPLAPVVKGAAGDRDLRILIAGVASARACDMVEHRFVPLRAKTPDQSVIGVMWLRDCNIVHDGTRVTVEVGGRGWEWVDRDTQKAGATFGVHQYVKFEMHARLVGEVDVAYDPNSHVGSLWLTPVGTPEVAMTPIGDVEVDRESVWADVIGALGSITGRSPDAAGEKQVSQQGIQAATRELAKGLTITMNLCNGLTHMMLGRLPRGIYGPAGPGETKQAPFTMNPHGLLLSAPMPVPDGLSIKLESRGPVRIGLACRDQAEAAAAAFLDGKPIEPKLLADQVVTGKATLAIGVQRCPVAVVAMSVLPTPVTFEYVRPLAEAAGATMSGPLLRCPKR